MDQQRHLAAILFTDIVGYTAMMQKDEQQAVAVIRQYTSVLERSVAAHHGEILNNYGDGSLCTFRSATEALNCAIQMQNELSSAKPSVPLRIGLHIGELYFEEKKVFGDGVNVASRIQSLGQANTILFSKEIFDKIKNQSGFKSVCLGSFEFKNVDGPMEVFALANAGLMVPKRENIEGKLKPSSIKRGKSTRKKITISAVAVLLLVAGFFIYSVLNKNKGFTGKEKSIAVLPFTNISSDKDNEYFSDGMTEEITTQLSRIADLRVIARTSAMLYKDSKKSIREIAEELGVASVLEGSVQKIGNDIRITAQLIDANTQEHIWAQKYDRDFKEVFAIQSEVAQEIAYQLNAKLTKEEKKKIEKAPTTNTQAYEFYLQGYQLHESFWETHKVEYFDNSKIMFEKALALDPNYALAHASLADLYNTYTNLIKKDSAFLSLQIKEIQKAWESDSTNDYVVSARGVIESTTTGNKDLGFKYVKKAVEINPNNPDNLWSLALTIRELGLIDESKLLLDRAVKLNPLSANTFSERAASRFLLNDTEGAIKDLETAIRLEPDFVWGMDALARHYAGLNRLDDAKKMMERSLKAKPSLTDHLANDLAYTYARLGDKKKALELAPKDWYVLIALEMNEEAINNMPREYANETDGTPYLLFKSQLNTYFLPIKNDPRFLEIIERSKQKYEKNKKKFSVEDLIRQFP